ncbi:MAG: PA0069 family radical SAM protein [Verrucomicrobiota bacterium]
MQTRGRGASSNPANRFEQFHAEPDEADWEEIARVDPDYRPLKRTTEYIPDNARSLITQNNSPDISFNKSLNPYRGCEHGCSYCYARPYHEFLGYSSGLDFETRILVKENAPELLAETLSRPSWIPESLACSGVTDCYQPAERKLKVTRGCLQVLADFRNPVAIITKNALVTRDLDLLAELNRYQAVVVVVSITTLDAKLAGLLEPRASRPEARLGAIRTLAEAGISVGLSLAPIIPGLNEHEIPSIFEAAAEAGATFGSGTVLRLPHAVKDLFAEWLQQHRPERRDLILNRIREIRSGALNSSDFGARMTGSGPLAEQIQQMLGIARRRTHLAKRREALSTASFRRVLPRQLELF